jgi:hypothetical protein
LFRIAVLLDWALFQHLGTFSDGPLAFFRSAASHLCKASKKVPGIAAATEESTLISKLIYLKLLIYKTFLFCSVYRGLSFIVDGVLDTKCTFLVLFKGPEIA